MAFALCNNVPAIPFEIAESLEGRRVAIDAAIRPVGQGIAAPDGEYDVVFDLSGTESGLREACDHVKAGGRLCVMSHLGGYTSGDFLLDRLTRKDVTLTISYLNGEPDNLLSAARMLTKSWNASWDQLIEVLPLDRLQHAFESRRTSPWCKTLVQVAPHAAATTS
jgi:threonine dehydrogenase-like Zn-dependent dehydrogenase